MDNGRPTIAVVGAGRMGTGIAQVFAYAGHQVILLDAKDREGAEAQRVLNSAAGQIAGNLGFLLACGVLAEDMVTTILKRIEYREFKQMAEALPGADVIFEAVPEVLEAKEAVFASIGALAAESALIASTTSTFLVDTLSNYVTGPERFMNTHWLNPAYLIPLVEVSPGQSTSPEALRLMLKLLEQAGKVPVKCAASPGFIVPRIQALAMNEAARLVEEGVASAEDIDKASKVGFGLRFAVLGLLEFIDWGGGDILYYASNYLKQALDSDRFSPPAVISENMEKGLIGMKTGQGFYNFSEVEVSSYQRQTIVKFVDLLQHLGLLASPNVD